MEKIKNKYQNVKKALNSLLKAIEQYQKTLQLTECTGICDEIFENQKELERTIRDSMIQRFEFCIDTTWKFFKAYLETVEKTQLETKSPRGIFKTLCHINFLTESQTETALKMLDARNLTSHLYKEDIAENLASEIPAYYTLLDKIIKKASFQQRPS